MKKKIIIAGVNNLIGFNLAFNFSKKKYFVIGTISRELKKYSNFEKKRLNILKKNNVKIVKMNVLFKKDIISIINYYKPSHWIHNISWVKNFDNKKFDFNKANKINLKNIEYIFILLNKNFCKSFLFTSTCFEYYYSNNLANENKFIKKSVSSYGYSKLIFTKKILKLSSKFKFSIISFRLFSPFGENDKESKFIQQFIKKLSNGEKFKINKPSIKRNFTHVDEIFQCYNKIINLCNKKKIVGVFNLCNNYPINVKNFLYLIADKFKLNKKLISSSKSIKSKENLIGNNSKLKKLINYNFMTNKKAIDVFYKKNKLY